MQRNEMKDMVVLVPGIMGSVLQIQNSEGSKDIWNLSSQAATQAATDLFDYFVKAVIEREPRQFLETLIIDKDDLEKDYLDDGIKATGLIKKPAIVPEFFKIFDGYSYISQKLTQNFDLNPGENYFEFAYDWRRDNRVAARLLKKLIDEKLLIWQKTHPEAKVIIIAHSMGGLVSRYYLEHLDGAEHCTALITLGTPYRGSVKALDFLANGFQKKPLPDLTDVLRSFTSIYQLLPMYPVVNVDKNWLYVKDTNIPHVNINRAKEAQEFLELINLPKNLRNSSLYICQQIIGIGQNSTFQSGILSNDRLKPCNKTLPPNPKTQQPLQASYATGDNTVPKFSAIPVDLDRKLQDVSFVETHGALQSNVQVWKSLEEKLIQLQGHTSDYCAPENDQSLKPTAGINLTVDDLYLRDEEVILGAEIINIDSDILKKKQNFGGLSAIITPVNANEEQEELEVDLEQKQDNQYQLPPQPNKLAPGLYKLQVQTNWVDTEAPKAVHDLFIITE
ncbi:hypothetical protein PI95_010105 [Hassallia byssoidea VB512170]|uniref:Lecithin:cholesterol acyltransferase n=1 Tax=Hassallia byssoidea VB512170 TaxID=1304833 RepID=A0A846H5K4_9CYAN|nr:hypothetical protein [Hassalia byssoidea]NEU72907.1 hypothetical protein [Hassalia byssoidea VB512170]